MTQQLGPQLDGVLKDAVKRALEELLGKPHRDLETLLARIADAAAARALDNFVEQNSLKSRGEKPRNSGAPAHPSSRGGAYGRGWRLHNVAFDPPRAGRDRLALSPPAGCC